MTQWCQVNSPCFFAEIQNTVSIYKGGDDRLKSARLSSAGAGARLQT